MNSLLVMYVTAALMALVATACTALCVAWSIPSWRRRLAQNEMTKKPQHSEGLGLEGWPAVVGGGLISIGIAACAVFSWYGCYCALNALSAAAR